MKSVVLVIVLAVATAGGRAEVSNDQHGGKTEQRLMQIERDVAQAVVKGDSSALENALADSATFTDPDGMVMDRAGLLADLKSGDLKFESSKLDDLKVQVYGDAAVVTYGSTDKGTYKGRNISGRYRWTDVFVNRNGQWKIVAGQGTRLGQQ